LYYDGDKKNGVISMAFWDLFKSDEKKNENYKHGLYQKSKELFPDADENKLVRLTCIAGLMARVAYSDLKIDDSEVTLIKKSIEDISEFDQRDSSAMADLALTEIQALAGQENHRYCYELNEQIDNNEKYQVLKLLFAIAAADGEVESVESEEIRHITKALLLEHKHYISAQATVRDKLRSLK
jgi:uncharacterized tellurite resistance protein B-like protein